MVCLRVLTAAGLMLLTACGSPAEDPGGVTVFAASSLAAPFTDLAESFGQSGAAVELSFAGSAALLAQLTGGARADVFAAADTTTMDRAVRAGVVTDPVSFATNTMTIVTAPGNPTGVTGFADLRRVGVVACAPQVPCGAAVSRIESVTGVTLDPLSEENSVTDVLNKIRTGQADAGLVYVTEAKAAGSTVTAVPFPESAAAVNTYRIGVVTDATNRTAAQGFIDLVTGPAGRDALTEAGFTVP